MSHNVLPFLVLFSHIGNILLPQPLECRWGIAGVEGVNVTPQVSSWQRCCCCSASVIPTIIMSALISCLLCMSAAASSRNIFLETSPTMTCTLCDMPLNCRHLSGSTDAGTLLLCAPISLSLPQSRNSYVCNQIVTTTEWELGPFMALSCLGIQCSLIPGCMQLPKMWPWESPSLNSKQRVSMAIGCPGIHGTCLWNAMLTLTLIGCPYSRSGLSDVWRCFYCVIVGLMAWSSAHHFVAWPCVAAPCPIAESTVNFGLTGLACAYHAKLCTMGLFNLWCKLSILMALLVFETEWSVATSTVLGTGPWIVCSQ